MEIGLPNAALDILTAAPLDTNKANALLTAQAALAAGDGEAALTAAAPFASDPAFADLVVNAHLSLGRASSALAAASALAESPVRGEQVARAAWSAGDWANAARDTGTIPGAEIASWLARRKAAVSEGLSSMRVGHVDFFALPSSTR